MFITDLKNEFYNVIKEKKILVLAHYDVDALCASKILQYVLRADYVSYVLIPVRGVEEMTKAYNHYRNEVKSVVFINCGGNKDLVDILEPEDTMTLFVLDSHRPTDLANVYVEQVKLLVPPTDDEKIPEVTQVFRDDLESEEEDDNSGDDDDEDHQAKRRRKAEEALEKRRERRQWEEERNQILFSYSQFSYHGKSSAVVMYELAWKLSKDTNDLLWWAIVGATEQVLLAKVEYQQYVLESGFLQNHVQRLSHYSNDDDDSEIKVTALKITFGKDLQLALYRHWTVEATLRYSRYSATKLRLWTLKGENKVKELLAEIGLPLAQSRQKFTSMDMVLRQEFPENMEKLGQKYNMERIMSATFFLQYGYSARYCASDFVYAILAHLSRTNEKSLNVCFMESLDCLSRPNKHLLDEGIEKCKSILIHIYKQVQTLLEMHQVLSAGPFLYLVLQEGTLDVRTFSNPLVLHLLAQFALEAYVSSTRSRKAPSQPLVASAPYSSEMGTCLVLGIPPVADESTNNFFGKAFEQAGEKISARMNMDFFDSSVVILKTEDRPKFFDALTSLLS